MMIPTRIHAAIDWVAVAGVELMGHAGPFSGRVRRLLKGSARAHAVYAAATDYELGAGLLPMRGHLAIDALVGAGFITAGLRMRAEPVPVRTLLVGMGVTELLLVAFSRRK